ncbi:haloalkane dehalogenase [Psychromonas aquimarina]|uniref:haloalkane dehalogenase n=1 Tax=Psychromonas aquimarina TaxID=444919 RepID=UPI00040B3979|nr:haloalkane dehalogenase [Psychromonas aquimarina]
MNLKSNTLRTPEQAFQGLSDYPFEANYMQVDGMRMHYLDEGKNSNKVIFLFHGQPSWSYLYRHMIPLLVNAGYRVIAPDLIGFGKSDKPVSSDSHTYADQVKWMRSFVQQLGIKHAAAFFQDWGGMIGLRVLAQEPQWLDRLVVSNTALAEMSGLEKFMVPKILKLLAAFAGKPSLEKFAANINYGNWAGYFRHAGQLQIGQIIQTLTTRELSSAEMLAYDAPFPTAEYYAAPRKMPEIVASELDAVNADWSKLKQWHKPVLTLFSDKDPFLADQGYDKKFQNNFKGAQGQPHKTIENASHFLQEDQSPQLASLLISWLQQTRF